jgi:hypothetical protein
MLNTVIQSCKTILHDYNQSYGYNFITKPETLRKNYLMEADVEDSCIVYDPMQIRQLFLDPTFARITGITDIKELVHILIVHEIGHLLDFKENPSLFESVDHFELLEINAWRIAETLIPTELTDKYCAFRDLSMESYRRNVFTSDNHHIH